MIEQYISFETATLAKEKGFDWLTYNYFVNKHDGSLLNSKMNYSANFNSWEQNPLCYTSRPTQSLLQKWLREEHNIHISIFYDHFSKTFEYDVCEKVGGSWNKEAGKTYEDVLEKGLIVALKLVK